MLHTLLSQDAPQPKILGPNIHNDKAEKPCPYPTIQSLGSHPKPPTAAAQLLNQGPFSQQPTCPSLWWGWGELLQFSFQTAEKFNKYKYIFM